ncbi:MAG: FG-GAP repeat domain-containing protein [Acidimicrobiia bacterium]
MRRSLFLVAAAGAMACSAVAVPSSAVGAAADVDPEPKRRSSWRRTVVEPKVIHNGHKPKAIIDANGDGQMEIFAMNVGEGGFLYQGPDWSVRSKISESTGGEEAQVADIDGDGDDDLTIGGLDYQLYWLENPGGDAALQSPWTRHDIASIDSHDVVLADLDRDGRIDVVTNTGILMQRPGNQWRRLDDAVRRSGQGVGVADIDGDGFLDVLAVRGTCAALFHNPLGDDGDIDDAWRWDVLGAAWDVTSFATGDITGDGRLEIVLAPSYQVDEVSMLRADGDAWKRTVIGPTAQHVHTGSLHVADFDNDNRLEVFLAEQEQSATDRLLLYSHRGDGSGWTVDEIAATGGHNPKIGDIDRDGDLDILNANHGFYGAHNPVELWLNDGPTGLAATPVPGSDAEITTPVPAKADCNVPARSLLRRFGVAAGGAGLAATAVGIAAVLLRRRTRNSVAETVAAS